MEMDKGKAKLHVVIVAGGSGSRFGSSVPKQYCLLDGSPVIMHTINRFHNIIPDARIVTVVAADMIDYVRQLAKTHSFSPGEIVIGGETRWHSVKNGLMTVKKNAGSNDLVLIHDAARPLFTPEIVQSSIETIGNGYAGAIPVIALTDTIRELKKDCQNSISTDRNRFVAVQTPQTFRLKSILKAFELPYSPMFTDEASVMDAAGMGAELKLVEGDSRNIKITRPVDLEIARLLIDGE